MIGRIGTTSEEVEKILRMKHQTVSARRTDLRQNGYTTYYIIDGIKVRRPTESGRDAYVEIATPRGRKAIEHNTPLQFDGRDPTRRRHGGNPASSDAFGSTDFEQIAREVLRCMCRYTP